jgi:hypothetical protein
MRSTFARERRKRCPSLPAAAADVRSAGALAEDGVVVQFKVSEMLGIVSNRRPLVA